MRRYVQTLRPVADTPYHYVECGLDDVYLLNGFVIEDDAEFGKLLTIEDADELHGLIAWNVVTKKERFTAQEVRFVRRQMGLTQANLAKHLDVTVQTLARWEKGQAAMSGPADRLLKINAISSFVIHSLRVDDVQDIMSRLSQQLQDFDGNRTLAEVLFDTVPHDESQKGWKEQPELIAA